MKNALITGASSGLGLELAKLFARDGYSLILVARRRDRLEAIAAELSARYPAIQVSVIDADLGLPGAGESLFRKVKALGLDVTFLVNNAGIGLNGAFRNVSAAKDLQMFDLNARTLLELTHFFLPEMIERKNGSILNVGSTAGFQPGPYMATYYASKAFVNSLSEALHEELKGTGVSCTVLAPGATATEFAKVAGMENSALFSSSPVATSTDVALYGYRAMMAGKAMAVPGLRNRALVQSLRVSPRFLVRKIAGAMNR
jgi:short-subunit dehydrogenase